MKNKYTLIFLLSIFTSFNSIAQVKLNWKLSIVPGKTVNTTTFDYIKSYAADPDKNMIFCCTKGEEHSKGFTLIKLNKNGLIEWQNNYLTNDSVNIYGMYLNAFQNDSLLITDKYGNIYLSFQNISLNEYQNIKLDKNGNILWQINLTDWPFECRINSKNEQIIIPNNLTFFPKLMKVDSTGVVTNYSDSTYMFGSGFTLLWIDEDDSVHFIDTQNKTWLKWNLNSPSPSSGFIFVNCSQICGTIESRKQRYIFSRQCVNPYIDYHTKSYTQNWYLNTNKPGHYNSVNLAPDGNLYYQNKEIDTLKVYKIDTTGVISVLFNNPFLIDSAYFPNSLTAWNYYLNYHPFSQTFISGGFYDHGIHRISCYAFDSSGAIINYLKVPLTDFEKIASSDWQHITNLNYANGYTFIAKVNDDSGFVAMGFTVGAETNVSGRLFIDANNNCVWDSIETVLRNHLVYATGTNFATVSDTNGIYGFTLPTGNYSLQISNPTMFTNTCSINYSINISSGTVISNLDFPLNYDPNYIDVGTTITAGNAASVNPNYFFGTHVFNNSLFSTTGDLIVTIDTLFQNFSANPTPSLINGNVLTWNNISLAGGQNQNILISCTHATNIPTGTPFSISSTFLPVTGTDAQLYDNSDFVTKHFLASYDPNEKSVLPEGNINQNDSVLHYRVQFQNTGNYEAFTVVIIDTLDSNLDLTSLHFGYAAHNYNYSIVSGNVLKIEFPQIMLPDSTSNEPASHGEVNYYINPKKNLANGTQILNTAYIYFDFNTPVATNTTINTFTLSGISEVLSQPFSVYPNPASENLIIRFSKPLYESKQIRILDLTGREILNQKMEANSQSEFNLSLKTISPGIYFLNIDNTTCKIVKL